MRTKMMSLLVLMFTVGECEALEQTADLFRKLDANGDGRLEKSELSESQSSHFARILRVADRDQDGALTEQEMSAGLRPPEPFTPPTQALRDRLKGADPRKMDRNGDGEITSDEVPEPLRDRFEKRLRDAGKTSVSVQTLAQLLGGQNESEGKPKSERSKKPPAKSDPSPKNASAKPDPAAKSDTPGSRKKQQETAPGARFAKMDRDSDGKLTPEELPERLKPRFNTIDADGDGAISREELEEAGRKKSRGKPESLRRKQ